MNREEVYRAIDSERAYQQAQGKADEHTHRQWEDVIQFYVYRAGDLDLRIEDWPKVIRKVAAVCVAALEQYDCPPREGYEQPSNQDSYREALAMIGESLRLTHMPDHNWEDADYELRDRIATRHGEMVAELEPTP